MTRLSRMHQVVLTALWLGVALGAPRGAGGEIVFATRREIDVGTDPIAATFVGGDPTRLLVAGGDGIGAFRRDGDGLARSARSPAGRGAQVLVAGPLGRDGANRVVFATRDAAQVRIALLDGRGGLGPDEVVALPAPARAARIAALAPGGLSVLLVLHDDGLSLLEQGAAGWERRELAAPRFGSDLAVADLDGDGRVDLIVADAAAGELRLLRGDGNGGFTSAAALPRGHEPRRLLAGDANGDGRVDLLSIGDDGLLLHAAEPDGRFAAPRRLLASPHLSDVGFADVNGDRRPDLLVADRSRGAVTVLLATADGSFATGDAYLVGPEPATLLVGDIDGDGHADGLAFSRLGGGATLLRGRGDGHFDGVPCAPAAFGDLTAIVADDFNDDGDVDLAVASEEGGNIGIFLGSGDGRFRPQLPIAVGRQPRALTVGDFNEDDRPDMAVANFGSDAVVILIGDGRGGFAAPRPITVGTGPSAISVGSFSSPTSVDLAIVNSLSNSVSVLYGDRRGQFSRVSTFPVAARPSFLIVGDTNEDGNQDLVVGSEFSESVAILLGTGAQLAEPKTNQLSGAAKPSAAEDFDRDGAMDLVNPVESGGAIEILPGVDANRFGKPIRVGVGRDPHALATADFDHDGRIDIAVVHRGSQTIAILLNRSPPPKPVPAKPVPAKQRGGHEA